jgi:hypothetical protein
VNLSYPENNIEKETYLVFSVVNTVFCVFWLGIPAIIYSRKAKNSFNLGDIQGGLSSANTAKLLNIIGFVIGGVCWLIGIISIIVFLPL